MKRSKHSLSHYRLTSMNQGELYPVMMKEILPGDTWRQDTNVFMRVAPLVSPVMHHVSLNCMSFFVPSRILWDGFEAYMPGKDPTKILPLLTLASTDNAETKKLAQSLGIGASLSTGSIQVQSLPFRAYNLIYNEFFRDQDITPEIPNRRGDTGDLAADYIMRKVSWEKDYFTTCRPYPQQGLDGEIIPVTSGGSTAPVLGLGVKGETWGTSIAGIKETDGTTKTYAQGGLADPAGGAGKSPLYVERNSSTTYPNIRADLSNVTLGNIKVEDLRRSMAMQSIREHRNTFGSRYTDFLAFLGVTASDGRLQRPEYLGGGKTNISFSEVLNTADTGTAEVGAMSGHGIAGLRTGAWRRFFEEHGYLITLLFVRPRTVYMNHVDRTYLRRKYNEFWQKELEFIGQQAITNFEIYGDSATPTGTFGYNGRYDEYRHSESFVTGEFRNTLDYWHMARKFSAQPVLNAAFIQADPTTRIYASTTTDQLYAMIGHRIAARRLVSKRAYR